LESPILIWSFLSAQNVEQAIGKGVTADFYADVDLTDNIAVFVELQDPVLVPLTQIKISPIKAEIRSSKFRTGEHLRKSRVRRVAIDIPIVLRPFADRKTH